VHYNYFVFFIKIFTIFVFKVDALYDRTINRINASTESALKGEFTFLNCKFKPTIWPDDRKPYELSSTLGTSLINCVLHLPRLNEIADPEYLSQIDFLKLNKEVLYNQLNTRLGQDVLQYLNKHNIKLKKNFIEMLKNHHELE